MTACVRRRTVPHANKNQVLWRDVLDTVLWWIIGVVIVVIAMGALVPSLYKRSTRRREKQLSYRAKRRIEL